MVVGGGGWSISPLCTLFFLLFLLNNTLAVFVDQAYEVVYVIDSALGLACDRSGGLEGAGSPFVVLILFLPQGDIKRTQRNINT